MAEKTYDTINEEKVLALVSGSQKPYRTTGHQEPCEPQIKITEKPKKAKKPDDGLTEIRPECENHPAREPENHPEEDFQPEPEVRPTKEKTEKNSKQRKSVELPAGKDYDEVFLARTQSTQRCQTYINRDTYLLIRNFLHVIAPDISISAYINNILGDHLHEHGDVIKDRYNSAMAKPLDL